MVTNAQTAKPAVKTPPAAAKPAAKPASTKPAAARKPAPKAAIKPSAKPVVKPAAKTAAKPVTKPAAKPSPKPAPKAAIKSKPVATPKAAVKAAPRPVATQPATTAVAPAPLSKADKKAAKPKKVKQVRDSFTMPENEYAVLAQVKKSCLKAGVEIKKSDLLRIGVSLIKNLKIADIKDILAALTPLKVGRPKK